MVVGDKHYKHTDEGPIKNVRRNRSPPTSSRGATEDGAGTSNNGDDDSGMREGVDYQAVIPEFNHNNQSKVVSDANYSTLIWLPNSRSLDAKVTCYLEIARKKYGYTQEQALGMLFWHKHDVDRALSDLQNFTPCPDDWTIEEKVLFEQSFSFHGKNFHRIHLMLPDKTIEDLVKYYYSWKKTRSHVSLIDKQTQNVGQSGNGSDSVVEDSDSDFEIAKETANEDVSVEPVRTLNRSITEGHNRLRNKHKPPSGIYICHDDLMTLAVNPHVNGEAMLKRVETEFESHKRNVIANRQEIITYKRRTSVGIDAYRPNDENAEINPKWTHSELLLAVQGIRHYGKNFTSIAELIGTKTDHHVRNFFFNYRTHYNLDDVLQEFELEHGKNGDNINMEIDSENRNPSISPPPPPLMKQSSSVARGGHLNQQDGPQKPPVLHHAAKNLPQNSRTIQHDPPPLFKQGSSVTTPIIAATK